jgi:hypothetical protein
MDNITPESVSQEFLRARRQADIDQLTARLLRREARLLPFDAIRRSLREQSPRFKGTQQVPLDLIVGSVGRYNEMTRRFLPLSDSMRDRWIKVAGQALAEGWPPVDLYKVGNVYFVRDGNHRLSAARHLGYQTIEANVWEYPVDIFIDPNESLDSILIRLGEKEFLEKTALDASHPDHGITFTTAGRYADLLTQIEQLRLTLEGIDEQPVSLEEAAAIWYEIVYLPGIQIIRDSGLLNAFPGRTEADLFAWMSLHRDRLLAAYGDFDSLDDLARCLTEAYQEGPAARVSRQVRRLWGGDPLPPLAEPDGGEDSTGSVTTGSSLPCP